MVEPEIGPESHSKASAWYGEVQESLIRLSAETETMTTSKPTYRLSNATNPDLVGLYQIKMFELLSDRPLPLKEEARRTAELDSIWLQLDYDDQDFLDTIPRN